jgi:hypothetical protein
MGLDIIFFIHNKAILVFEFMKNFKLSTEFQWLLRPIFPGRVD